MVDEINVLKKIFFCQIVKSTSVGEYHAHAYLSSLQRLAGATLLVFANKQDLPGALSKEAIKEALALDEIKNHHWCIMGCSAITGENLLAGIDWMLDDIAARIFTAD
ncbi:ADP-ribosylation factor-like protein 2 [Cololabis saira]|uniref:ADP-ribosylation factor-like protein 2 n=1 Tax=Cololabis saira TaxID=129043 RepID=UPI002AD3273E|nr:ADP-ribosylation factor-like protein 2 [Cololabis saira]